MTVHAKRTVGRRLHRLDGVGKVTGALHYVSDMTLTGMLFGRVFRSTEPHARIIRLDVSKAQALPGVHAVLTAADLPLVRYGPLVQDMPLLARERVLFVGQPVALIAAKSLEVADRALELIEVEYEALPAVLEPEDSLGSHAPLLHPEWKDYTASPVLARNGNVSSKARISNGDVDKAFAESYRVYEHSFSTQIVHAGYTEARVAIAQWNGGEVTVWSNAQLPFEVQTTLSAILRVDLSKVRVIVPAIGGGFGGKLRIGVEHFAAVLARATRRPVRIMTTVHEELVAAHPRQPATIVIKSGVTKEGRILAKQARVTVDTGAFAGSGPGVAAIALQILAGPYDVANIDLESFAVYTNKTPTGSFRAPSGPMGNFAVECHMDLIADDLGIDPLELRLRNLVEEGGTGPSGETLQSVSIRECLLKAAEAIGWDQRRPERNRGKGLACGWWMTTGGAAGVYVKISPDGSVSLTSGAVELGTAALTGAAQILAEELGVDLGDIRLGAVDTHMSPYDYGAQGSRTTFSVGNACRSAAAMLRDKLFALAARELQAPVDTLELRDKHVFSGNRQVSLAELARVAQLSGEGGLIAHGTTNALPTPYDRARVENHTLPAWNTPSYHAHAVDLSVDPLTGEITIHRYVVAQDVGFAINPTYIEGQVEGGVAQGLGQAMSEEIVFRGGRVLNPNLTDYKMPTSMDVPRVEAILVESPSAAGPFGAKGVGEPPVIEPPAAIANAVASATGLMMHSLPITAEKIAMELHRRATSPASATDRLDRSPAAMGKSAL
jgi:CO/xanthine dehydrogenase Mo-binding subunit